VTEPAPEAAPTQPLPPLIDWCSRNGEVVLFAALLLPVLLEGCAIHAAKQRVDQHPPAAYSD
jgi:hypothetical protein